MDRAPFDEATALGHHWAGEEHFLLTLAADAGLTHEALVTAVAQQANPPFPKDFDGCLSAPSYHTILGRARGYALGAGRKEPTPADYLAALLWDPAALPSRLIEAAGGSRPGAEARAQNPLARPAERQAVALGHPFYGDDHVILALLAGEPDDDASAALRRAGASHDRLAAHLAFRLTHSDPPVDLPPAVTSAEPNPRCHQLLGCAEGLAAARGDGAVRSTDALIAYLWQPDGDQVIVLEHIDTSAERVLAELKAPTPALPVPQPDRTPWGDKVYVAPERMDDVVGRLARDLPMGSWGCNSHDGRQWVVAHAHIDLAAIVAEVVAS